MTQSFSRGGSGGSGFGKAQSLRPTYASGKDLSTQDPIKLLKFLQQRIDAKKREASVKAGTETSKNKKSPLETSLTRPMQAMEIGNPVPVIFCRRREGGTGGVMVRPRATECRFVNSATTIEAAYHCLLGDGYIYPVQVRDVRNGPNRQGLYSQNFSLRAGTWRPERLATEQDGYNVPDFPQNCGGGGDYNGATTIEFRNTYNPKTQLDNWKLHWSTFLRNGMRIDRGRVLDAVVGASDNFCDLYIWAQVRSGLMTEADIDMTEMQKAARFLDVNQLYCNAEFDKGTSLPDFLTGILPAFLLRETSIAGKFALRPVVPTNADGTIKASPITPDWIFDERSIAPGSYDERWSSSSSKRLVQINVLWRQQTSDTEIPFTRDLQIMAEGVTNPRVETFDLSELATSEGHAALAGGYRQAMQALGQGTASVRLLAGNHTGLLRAGMVIQVVLALVTETEMPALIRDFWWVDSITLDGDGSETLGLVHCPVDAQGRSLVALHILAARDRAQGIILPYPAVGLGDEAGRSTDTSSPASSTSGVPFTQGGGGANSSFNRASPPAPPANNPPAPPVDDGDVNGGVGGSNVGEAGGTPTDPTYGPKVPLGPGLGFAPSVNLNIGPAIPDAWPGECEFGVHRIRTLIQGATATGTVVNYIVITIEPVTAEVVDAMPITYTPPGGSPITIICDVYRVRVQEPIPNAPRVFDVIDIVGPGVSYPFSLEVLDWQCKLRDGTTGPTRTPSDPPLTP